MRGRLLCGALTALLLAGCDGSSADPPPAPTGAPTSATSTAPATTPTAEQPLDVTEVARGLDTVWSLAWDPQGRLWYTERSGLLSRLDGPTVEIDGVVESGEAGLSGLEIDDTGRFFLMYTAGEGNRVVRLESDGSQTVLADGIEAASVHDGGRIRLGPDGALYASTGDAGNGDLAQEDSSLNGKILRVDPDGGQVEVFSKGHRNAQGLCFDPDGRLLATEHGPDEGDEINIVTEGSNGGWPETVGNGIQNYTPTIAPAGCVVYSADLIPQWRGSLLFVTLKDESLRRLTFDAEGGVSGEEVLYGGRFGRLRDVAVGPDGAVYLATSNLDGRGDPNEGDDRILRIAPRE